MEEPFFYRNKLQYPVGIVDGKPVMGVFANRSHRIIPTKNCHIQLVVVLVNQEFVFSF